VLDHHPACLALNPDLSSSTFLSDHIPVCQIHLVVPNITSNLRHPFPVLHRAHHRVLKRRATSIVDQSEHLGLSCSKDKLSTTSANSQPIHNPAHRTHVASFKVSTPSCCCGDLSLTGTHSHWHQRVPNLRVNGVHSSVHH